MITIKYKIELPNINNFYEDFIFGYKKSWFYQVYNIELVDFFIPKSTFEKLTIQEQIKVFNDFVRLLSQMLDDNFEKCHFELIFLMENKERFISNYFNLDVHPQLILIKQVLFKKEFSLSYQLLENISTKPFLTKSY